MYIVDIERPAELKYCIIVSEQLKSEINQWGEEKI